MAVAELQRKSRELRDKQIDLGLGYLLALSCFSALGSVSKLSPALCGHPCPSRPPFHPLQDVSREWVTAKPGEGSAGYAVQVQLYIPICEKHGRASAFLAPCRDPRHQTSSCGALSAVPDTGAAAAQDRPSVPLCPLSQHRSPALHLLCSLVLGLLYQCVPGLHHAQNLVDVGLQPGHDSRVLPQGVCPAHVQGCQLVQGG